MQVDFEYIFIYCIIISHRAVIIIAIIKHNTYNNSAKTQRDHVNKQQIEGRSARVPGPQAGTVALAHAQEQKSTMCGDMRS